jgi:pimeloyl-ACP methyl ester carboxylesterase
MNAVRSIDGTKIAFDRSGTGPARIYISPAFSHRSFDPAMRQVAALLASRFTVFTYDRRGRGESTDTAPYSVQREIEDLDALITEAGGSAYVYGMSSGAVLALDAAGSGLAITKLALYEAMFVVDDSRPPVPDGLPAKLAELASAGRRSDAVELFLTQAVGVPAEFVGQMRQAPVWPGFEEVAHTLAYDTTLMDGTMTGEPLPPERTKRWSTIAVPTLVMDGGASPGYAHSAAQLLVDVLPHAQRRTLDGQTHDVSPDIVAPVLAEFFG